jgi:hypothetical protein
MSADVERLNYYDREYLRRYDFVAEQRYHVDMRRRLNLALHLWGIVDGLELRKGVLTPGIPNEFYITKGMAIDAYGREIFLFADHPLSEDDFLANRVSTPGSYAVWIAYVGEASTPPAAGYRVCDLADQYTRWREFYRIVLTNDSPPSPEPTITDAPPGEDAVWRVRLGTITLQMQAGRLAVSDADANGRVYIGLRAQRIIAPLQSPPLKPPAPPLDPVLSQIAALDSPLALALEETVFAEQNLIVGDNFDVDKGKIQPPPPPLPPFPKANGNLKVAGDLFLKGNLYASSGADWLGLTQLFQNMIPEIQIHAGVLATSAATADPPNNTVTVPFISQVLKKPSKASILAALSGIEWESTNGWLAWITELGGAIASPVQVQVNVGTVTKKAGTDNEFEAKVSWTVGPKSAPPAPATPMIHVRSLSVSYIVVFYP